jgi:hypothetical protein
VSGRLRGKHREREELHGHSFADGSADGSAQPVSHVHSHTDPDDTGTNCVAFFLAYPCTVDADESAHRGTDSPW